MSNAMCPGDCSDNQFCNARVSEVLQNTVYPSDYTVGVCVTPKAAGSSCTKDFGETLCLPLLPIFWSSMWRIELLDESTVSCVMCGCLGRHQITH